MTSGYMFTRIRGSPYSGENGQWIASGYQNQFGQEVQVVAFICLFCYLFFYLRSCSELDRLDGLLAFSFLMLILVIPYQSSPQRQRLQVYLWTGVIMIIYSVLVSLFRVKNRGELTPSLLALRLKCDSYRISFQTVPLDFRALWRSEVCISDYHVKSNECRENIRRFVYSKGGC